MMSPNLRRCAGGADRFVVLDTETTGVYPSDRIVEIALVTVTLSGEVVDVYETLIQPNRHLSAGHIHGITASMVVDAPTFDEIAGDVALRLHGACVVAHNLPFDYRMVRTEFERVGSGLNIPAGIDTLRVTSARLHVACEQHDINLDNAHSACADALATAKLFMQIAERCPEGAAALAPTSLMRSGRVRRRHDVARSDTPDSPLITFLASRLPHAGVESAFLEYLELVGRAVADLHVTSDERRQLEDFARELGLTEREVEQCHRRFVNELIDAATADNVVTDAEYDSLLRVASALDVGVDVVESRLQPYRSSTNEIVLEFGMSVVFTGEHSTFDRETLTSLMSQQGLVVQSGVTQSTQLLAAADPSSMSGKAAKARRYGIPIVDINHLAAAQVGDSIAAVGASSTSLMVVSCPRCLTTWTVSSSASRHSKKLCSLCTTEPARQRPATIVTGIDTPDPNVGSGHRHEQLHCDSCRRTWHREITRGRKPRQCPDCVNASG